MLDIKWIRENPQEFDRALVKRNMPKYTEEILELDKKRRELITLIQELQHARKEKSKQLGMMQDKAGPEFARVKVDVEHINQKLEELTKIYDENNQLDYILDRIPNLPEEEVPFGTDESSNKLIKTIGEPKKIIDAKQHFEIGEAIGLMDFAQTVKMSGSRFVTLKGQLARLERAVANFMLDTHTKEYDYLEVSPPYLVKNHAMYNVGQLPKFEEDSFVTTSDYRLIPTSEVSLTNLVADTIIPREELPLRFTAYTPCFRSEAGSAGKDTRGMIRLHQFNKVELVSITTPDESKNEHERMLNACESILKKLELPYRVMMLCSGDMGFSAKKTYDLEVWLPGQNQYREISSVSNCGDFQARRMKARYKEFGSHETTLVHTLNGSGLAVGRTVIAIIENYQNSDGSISIPDMLVSYMDGLKKIVMA